MALICTASCDRTSKLSNKIDSQVNGSIELKHNTVPCIIDNMKRDRTDGTQYKDKE